MVNCLTPLLDSDKLAQSFEENDCWNMWKFMPQAAGSLYFSSGVVGRSPHFAGFSAESVELEEVYWEVIL